MSGHFTRPLTSTDPPVSSQKLWAETEADLTRLRPGPGPTAIGVPPPRCPGGHHRPPCTGVCNLGLSGLMTQSEARASGLEARPLGCRAHILSIVPYRRSRDGGSWLVVRVPQVFQEPLVLMCSLRRTCDVTFVLQTMATASQVLQLSSPLSPLHVPGSVLGAGETGDEDSSVLGAQTSGRSGAKRACAPPSEGRGTSSIRERTFELGFEGGIRVCPDSHVVNRSLKATRGTVMGFQS